MKPSATSPAYYTPSGQLSHAGQRKWFAPAEIKRMLDNLAANSRLPGLGTAYGRMMLEEAISIPEFEACRRWDDLRASYLAALDASGLRSQLSALDARGGEAPDPGSELGEKIATRDRRIIADYMAALRVMEPERGEAHRIAKILAAKPLRIVTPESRERVRAMMAGLVHELSSKSTGAAA